MRILNYWNKRQCVFCCFGFAVGIPRHILPMNRLLCSTWRKWASHSQEQHIIDVVVVVFVFVGIFIVRLRQVTSYYNWNAWNSVDPVRSDTSSLHPLCVVGTRLTHKSHCKQLEIHIFSAVYDLIYGIASKITEFFKWMLFAAIWSTFFNDGVFFLDLNDLICLFPSCLTCSIQCKSKHHAVIFDGATI